MSEFLRWVLYVLEHKGGAVPIAEIGSDLNSMGARASRRDFQEACDELVQRDIVEEVDPSEAGTKTTAYRLKGLPELTLYLVADHGPTDVETVREKAERLGSDATREEFEGAIETLVERGEVAEVSDGRYDVTN